VIPLGNTTDVAPDAELLSEGRAQRLGSLLAALGHPVRLRLLLRILADPAGEVCVCDMVDLFDLSQPTVSHHLRTMRTAGLISSRGTGWSRCWPGLPTTPASPIPEPQTAVASRWIGVG
jgi:hypothetical protein